MPMLRSPSFEIQIVGTYDAVRLEHVPAKCKHFADKNMLQHIELARFLVAEVIPLRRKAR
jgi:hypothetical protein